MTTTPYQQDPPDWSQVSEYTHAVALPRRSRRGATVGLKPTVISAPRPCWLDNVECVARYEIGRLDCGQWVNIEGVVVTRTSAHSRLRYTVNGCPACGLREAVQAVCEAVAEGSGK